jgi:hypothetical protein
VRPDRTTEPGPGSQLTWLGLMVLVVFSGSCTIFVLMVTVAQAWQEHTQAQWPEVTARVDQCGMRQTSTGRREKYHIHCRLSYAVGAEQNVSYVYSRNVPSPRIWQYPPNQIGPLEEWVDAHPPGTPIVVRYDPAHHTKIVLAKDYMPQAGPRTPRNLKLLAVWAESFLVLLIVARIARPVQAEKRVSYGAAETIG